MAIVTHRNSPIYTPPHWTTQTAAHPQPDMESANPVRRYPGYSTEPQWPPDYAWGMPHVQQYPSQVYGYGYGFAYPPQMPYPPVHQQGLEAAQMPAHGSTKSDVIFTPEDTPPDSDEGANDGTKANDGWQQMREREQANSLLGKPSHSVFDGVVHDDLEARSRPCYSVKSDRWDCPSTFSDAIVMRGAVSSRSHFNEDCNKTTPTSAPSLAGSIKASSEDNWGCSTPIRVYGAGRHIQPSCITDDGSDAWSNDDVRYSKSPDKCLWSHDGLELYNGSNCDFEEVAIQRAMNESCSPVWDCHESCPNCLKREASEESVACDSDVIAFPRAMRGTPVTENDIELKPGANELDFVRRCIMKANLPADDRYKALGILSTLSSSGKILHTPNIVPAAPAAPKDTTGETLGRIEAFLKDLHISKTTSTTPPKQTPPPTTTDTKASTDLAELRTRDDNLSKALKVDFSEEHTRHRTLTTEVSHLKELLWSLDSKLETFANRINHEVLELKQPYQAPGIDFGRYETHIQRLEDKVDQLDSTATGTKNAFGTLYQDLRNKMTSLEIGYHALRK